MPQNSIILIKIKLIESIKKSFKQRSFPMFKGLFDMVGVARVELATFSVNKGI